MKNSTALIPVLAASATLAIFLGSAPASGQSAGYPRYDYYRAHPSDNILCPGFAPLVNGQCVDASGFSGAALASQALSSLSQSTTQASNNNALGKMRDRREQEANSCAPGFSRIDGECRRNAPPREAARPVAPPKQVAEKPRGKARVAVHGRARKGGEPSHPTGPVVTTAGGPPAGSGWLLFGAPIPISPDTKFGAWAEGFGDFERRTGGGDAYVVTGAGVPQPLVPVRISVESETTSFGMQMGFDFTTRGVLKAGDGLITGILIGAAHSDLSLKTRSTSSNFALVDNGSSKLDARFNGGSVGLYATYFDGPLSADFLVKTDVFNLTASFTDYIAFAPDSFSAGTPIYFAGRVYPYSATESTPVVDVSLAGNVNYRFPLTATTWIEPTFGVQYTTTMYDAGGARIGLADGEQVRVQGGARVGTGFHLGATPSTLTVTGLVYDDVLIAGGFVRSLAFNGGNLLQAANEGQPRGRGIIAWSFDHGDGLSSYVQGEVRGGDGLIGGGGKAGVRLSW
jgi:hypothetical protein